MDRNEYLDPKLNGIEWENIKLGGICGDYMIQIPVQGMKSD